MLALSFCQSKVLASQRWCDLPLICKSFLPALHAYSADLLCWAILCPAMRHALAMQCFAALCCALSYFAESVNACLGQGVGPTF